MNISTALYYPADSYTSFLLSCSYDSQPHSLSIIVIVQRGLVFLNAIGAIAIIST